MIIKDYLSKIFRVIALYPTRAIIAAIVITFFLSVTSGWMEKESFELVTQGRKEEALKSLSSDAYNSQKQVYAQGNQISSIAVQNQIQQRLVFYQQEFLHTELLTPLSLIIIIPLWIVLLQIAKRSLRDRKQVELRLQYQLEQERLLGAITQRMRSSLNIEEILKTTVEEVHHVLKSDRVLVCKIAPDFTGSIIAEATWPHCQKSLNIVFPDGVMSEESYNYYLQNNIFVTCDRDQQEHTILTPSVIKFLIEIQVQALVAVPIIHDQILWGLLVVHQCDHPRQWQEWEINLLEQTTNQLAIAIQQANLFKQLQQELIERQQAEAEIVLQLQQQQTIAAITQQTREPLNLMEILNSTVEEVRHVLQSDRVLVYRVFPNGTGASIAEATSPNQIKILDRIFPEEVFPKENYDRYVKGRIYTLSDREDKTQSVLPCLVDFLTEIRVRAKVVVPIIQNQTLWGLLIAHQCEHPRQWQGWEIHLLEQIANQLAIAIQQASLFKQLQQELVERQIAKEEIALQLRRQQALGAITQRIRESLDVSEILWATTLQVKDVIQCDRVIVCQFFPDGRTQIVEETVSGQFVALKNQNWREEIWGDELLNCYWQGEPRIVPDVMDDIWTYSLREYFIEGQIQSKIVAPILQEVRNDENHRWVSTEKSIKIWGALVVHACHGKRVWQDSEAQLLQQTANQLAIAIQQASLFEELQIELAERQRAESRLTETNVKLAISNQELARATRLKDEFLANMSHELRTPLNAILGMTEGLQEGVFGSINKEQIQALQTVDRSGSHLLELIDDILDLAKIEAGQIELDCALTSVSHLCQSSMIFIKQQALQKRIQLDIQIQPNLPDVLVDERRMRQVLINLLNNAVKFTPEEGCITLKVTQFFGDHISPTSPPECFLCIAIIDTGIGISLENINKLFQPFIQIDNALNREYTGTGLGLALVKRIVELHGGNVELTSELGIGSCFTVKLPFTATTLPAVIPENKLDAKSEVEFLAVNEATSQLPLILLAEDNEANISTVSNYLQAKGYRILLAKDGQEAVDFAAIHHPDLILMDIQMPRMDGLEATKQIRLDPKLVDIPIIALTALAMASDRDRCLQAGANEYLTKPVKLKALANLIQTMLAS